MQTATSPRRQESLQSATATFTCNDRKVLIHDLALVGSWANRWRGNVDFNRDLDLQLRMAST